jgi:hypothetical protein
MKNVKDTWKHMRKHAAHIRNICPIKKYKTPVLKTTTNENEKHENADENIKKETKLKNIETGESE